MHILTLRWWIRSAALWLLVPALASAQTLDNKGRDFIMGFMPNIDTGSGSTTELHLTGDVGTNVTIQYPVNSPTFNTTVAVTPGSVTIVTIPLAAAETWRGSPESVLNNAVRAFSDNEFVAYMIHRRNASTDAALALPVDVLNTEYLAQTYIPLGNPPRFGAEFVVVAAFDNTQVTVTPTAPLSGSLPAGSPITFTLNRGEGWLGDSGTDLTGSRIEASKPVTVTTGNRCTNIPPGTTACDHVFEVAQPLASWGTRSIVSPLPNRPSGSVYRVLAAEDGTTLTLDGATVATLNAGEFYDSGVIPGAHVFASTNDKPIFVTQYMTGISFAGATQGDPAQGNMVPTDQYLSAYTFSTIGGNQFAQNFLSIIAEDADVANGTIFLDGVPVPASAFTAVAGTGFSYASLPLTEGTHSTLSSGVHGITVQGYDQADSYIYPGGARFNFINQGADSTPPICSGSFDGPTFFGGATDLASTDPDNTGIFFVVLSDDSDNLALTVAPFTPGDEQVSYRVDLDDANMNGSGTVIVTDGAGNTCQTPVSITVDPQVVACTPDASLYFSGYDVDPTNGTSDPRGEYAELANDAGDGTSYDLSGCDFLAFDPFTETVIYATDATSVLGDGGTYSFANVLGGSDGQTIPMMSLYDGPGAFALIDGSASVGQSVLTVLANAEVVAAVVYYDDDRTFVEARGGTGSNNRQAILDGLAALANAVDIEDGAGAFALAVSAAPNPFSDRTTVSFGVGESADARVVVYDALGREVAVLADGPFVAGRHEVTFDAQGLPAGVYVIQAIVGAEARTARLTLTR